MMSTTRRRPRAVPRAAGVVLVAGSALWCLAGCATTPDSSDACPSALVVGHDAYSGALADQVLPRAERIGSGDLAGCADVDDLPADHSRVEVFALRGVDRRIAVGAVLGGDLQLFVSDDVGDVCAVRYTRCR